MQVTLTFDPITDRHDLNLALHAQELMGIILETDERLKGYIKHGHAFNTPTEALEAIRQGLSELMMDSHVKFDEG